MISCTYIPIVIMPHDITGITIVEALILILLLTVITVSRSININASTIVMPVISCGIITIGIYVQLIIVVILFIK